MTDLRDIFKRINIFQIGVGGTGSWLVPSMCKFLNNIQQRYNRETLIIDYIIIDDDIVEDRNILRQNFESWDVDRPKISAMIRKYSLTFKHLAGVHFRPDNKLKFDKIFRSGLYLNGRLWSAQVINGISLKNSIIFIFGCVDSNKTRRALFKYLQKFKETPVVYFDSGNDLYHGQIVTTVFNLDNKFHREYFGKDEWFWFKNERRFKQPKFQKLFPLDIQEGEAEGTCEFFGDQSQSINIQAASLLFMCFQNSLIQNSLPPNIINFNSTGYSYFDI